MVGPAFHAALARCEAGILVGNWRYLTEFRVHQAAACALLVIELLRVNHASHGSLYFITLLF